MHTLLIALLLASAAPQFEVQPLDGPPVVGTLVELDAKHVILETAQGRVSLETERLMCIAPKQKPESLKQEPAAWIKLADGSALVAAAYAAEGGKARITLVGGEAIELPTRRVAMVRFQLGTQAMAAEWSRILAATRQTDLLVAVKGDSIDYHKGAVKDVSDKTVQFELDGEPLDVKRSRVYGIIYSHPAEDGIPEAVCRVADADGSRWAARTLSLSDKLQWTTPTGVTMTRPLDQVLQIDLSGGKVVYLSDLTPETMIYTPYFPLEKELQARLDFFAPRQDRNLESKPLRIGQQQFRKGLAMHSRTELVYYLPGQFSRFAAIAGIDSDIRPRGSVRLVVRGNEKVLLETTVAGNDVPQPIEVEITGVRRLTILADFTSDSDVAGHLDLGNARVIK